MKIEGKFFRKTVKLIDILGEGEGEATFLPSHPDDHLLPTTKVQQH